MKAMCNVCKNEYEEDNEENFFFVESGCQMICHACIDKRKLEFEQRINNQLKLKRQ